MRVLSLLRGVVLLRCHVSMIVFGIFSWNDIGVRWAFYEGSTYLSWSISELVFPGKRVLALTLELGGSHVMMVRVYKLRLVRDQVGSKFFHVKTSNR